MRHNFLENYIEIFKNRSVELFTLLPLCSYITLLRTLFYIVNSFKSYFIVVCIKIYLDELNLVLLLIVIY